MASKTITRTSVIYSDFYNDFDPHPVSGDLLRLTNENAVKRSIRNLLTTGKGERPYRPDIGSGLNRLLFEPISPVTEQLLVESIEETINHHEPRASLKYINVDANPDSNSYIATIVFSLVNIIEPITLSVILQRIR